MKVDLFVHVVDSAIESKLDRILNLLSAIKQEEDQLMAAIDDLTAAVAAEDTVIDSAVVLLGGLKTALDAAIASGNPAALTALSADIGNKTTALATAITANTPAAPGGGSTGATGATSQRRF